MALRELRQYLFENNVRAVLDVDLKDYFGTIDRKILEGFLRDKITDEKFIRYIIRMFKAGILSQGELKMTEEGVVQGSIVSPILANVMAHHVVDLWFEETVVKHCRGKVKLFRYADDLCICCESPEDAIRIEKALMSRLKRFNLDMNTDKTKIIPFDKNSTTRGGKAGTFDFLGFTFYWGKSKRGHPIPKVKTDGKRMRAKLKRVNEWAKYIRNRVRLSEIWRRFCRKIQGHIAYYGVSFNLYHVRQFVWRAVKILFKWFNRRSQRKSFTWEKFHRYMDTHPLPQIHIVHYLCETGPND